MNRRIQRRLALVAVAGCAVLPALVGCSAADGPIHVGGRTLLTHPSTGASADALGHGVLAANAEGCVTMGAAVLVVPEGSGLLADGSIRVLGKTYKVGSTLRFGGGGGDAPPHSRCGAGASYFWVD